jgi:hypothetical protein
VETAKKRMRMRMRKKGEVKYLGLVKPKIYLNG